MEYFNLYGWPIVLLAVLLVLQVVDAFTTIYALKDANASEMNPRMRWLFDRTGVLPGMLLMKALYFIMLIGPLWYWGLSMIQQPLWIVGVLGISIYYAWTMWENIRRIKKLRQWRKEKKMTL